MSVGDVIKLITGGMVGAAAATLIMLAINLFVIVPDAEERGAVREREKSRQLTEQALGELTNEADRARVARRICISGGGVYINGTGKCRQGNAE